MNPSTFLLLALLACAGLVALKSFARYRREQKKAQWKRIDASKIEHQIIPVAPEGGGCFYLLTIKAEFEYCGELKKESVDIWRDRFRSIDGAKKEFHRLFGTTHEIYVNPEKPGQVMK
jgi:hypothetical protein